MIPSYYEFHNPVKISSGNKALDNLPYELNQLGVSRPLIITDPGVVKAGLMKLVKRAFASTGIIIGALYDKTPPDSSMEVVNEIADIFREQKCDSLIAVGGGSPIDTAKGVNIVISENSNDLRKFMGAELLKKPMKPLIVVPTTSGTGSEATYVAVIADKKRNVKMPFTSYNLLPRVAILDPRMTLTVPPHITAATGMDALTHAMESYISLQKNPLSDAYATTAISLIRENLLTAVKKGNDKKARLAMANASLMAGVAFSNSMVGVVHGLGHATGAVSHIPHGLAMSIFLDHGLEYNLSKRKDLIEELLYPLAGEDEYLSTPKEERAQKTIETVKRIKRDLFEICGLPRNLKEAGVNPDDMEPIAQTTLGDGTLLVNPEALEFSDAIQILEKAYDSV